LSAKDLSLLSVDDRGEFAGVRGKFTRLRVNLPSTQVTWNEPSQTATDPALGDGFVSDFCRHRRFHGHRPSLFGVAFWWGFVSSSRECFPAKFLDRPRTDGSVCNWGLSGNKIDTRDLY